MNKKAILIPIIFICCCSFLFHHQKTESNEEPDFELYYGFLGLGSNFFKDAPVFRIKGLRFISTEEKTTYFSIDGKKEEYPVDTICEGTISIDLIDSIKNIVKNIEDSVFCFNSRTYSGGIDLLEIHIKQKNYYFSMHNCADSTAVKILSLINSELSLNQTFPNLGWYKPPNLKAIDSLIKNQDLDWNK